MRLSQIDFSTSECGEQELTDSQTNSFYCSEKAALHTSSSISLKILKFEKIHNLRKQFLCYKLAQWKLPFFAITWQIPWLINKMNYKY